VARVAERLHRAGPRIATWWLEAFRQPVQHANAGM
jgi:hypothetical protein